MNFYLISPPRECKHFNYNNFKKILESINVKYLQLRPKYENDKQNKNYITKYFKIFDKICRLNKIKLIINDDVNLVKELQSDGVHLGQDDLPTEVVRRQLGMTKLIGRTTHSFKQGQIAKAAGADYISVGPIWDTPSKPGRPGIGFDYLETAHRLDIPYVAIGGINLTNIDDILHHNPPLIGAIRSISTIEELWKKIKKS